VRWRVLAARNILRGLLAFWEIRAIHAGIPARS
jgi:hypothetical protein